MTAVVQWLHKYLQTRTTKKDVQRRRRAADNKNQVHVDVRRWYSNYNKLWSGRPRRGQGSQRQQTGLWNRLTFYRELLLFHSCVSPSPPSQPAAVYLASRPVVSDPLVSAAHRRFYCTDTLLCFWVSEYNSESVPSTALDAIFFCMVRSVSFCYFNAQSRIITCSSVGTFKQQMELNNFRASHVRFYIILMLKAVLSIFIVWRVSVICE